MYAIQNRRAFSLIELVIVIVIIGIIGAIAIPRMSRGAAGAADSALTANLAVLRNAIDLYQTEHGGTYPTAADIVAQLTQYSDDAGGTNGTKTGGYIYGPYLRAIPPLPVGSRKGQATIGALADDPAWVYDPATGQVYANLPVAEEDDRGTPYRNY